MRELRDVLAEAEDEQALRAMTAGGATATDAVVRRVRKVRARRTAVRAGVFASVLVVVVAGGLLLVRPSLRAVLPAVVVPTASPSPSQPATPAPTASAPTQFVVSGLGSLPQATEQTLAEAAPGWALIVWQPTVAVSPDSLADPTVESSDLLLAAPDGSLFHLASFHQAFTDLQLDSWTVGSRDVAASWCPPQGDPSRANHDGCAVGRLDLLTGEFSNPVYLGANEGIDGWLADGRAVVGQGGASIVMLSPDGSRSGGLAGSSDSAALVSPDATRVALLGSDRVLRLSEGSGEVGAGIVVPDNSDDCMLMGWLDTHDVLVACMPGQQPRPDGALAVRYITVDVDSGASTQTPRTPTMATWGGHSTVTLDGGRVLFAGGVDSFAYCGSLQEWSAGTTRTVLELTEGSELFGAGGGQAWFGTERTCTEAAPKSVEVLHPDGTTTTVIAQDTNSTTVVNVLAVSVARR